MAHQSFLTTPILFQNLMYIVHMTAPLKNFYLISRPVSLQWEFSRTVQFLDAHLYLIIQQFYQTTKWLKFLYFQKLSRIFQATEILKCFVINKTFANTRG